MFAAALDRGCGSCLREPARAAAFTESLGVTYPSLFGEREAIGIGRAYGNVLGVLPYTVIVDRQGRIRYTRAGLVEEQDLVDAFGPLLEAG